MREKTVEEKRVAINRAATAAVAFLAGTRPTRSESDLPPRIELVRALAKGLRELEPENWVARLKPVGPPHCETCVVPDDYEEAP